MDGLSIRRLFCALYMSRMNCLSYVSGLFSFDELYIFLLHIWQVHLATIYDHPELSKPISERE